MEPRPSAVRLRIPNHWIEGHEFEQTPGDGEGQTVSAADHRLQKVEAMDMSLSKLQEMVKDGEARRAAVHGVAKSDMT